MTRFLLMFGAWCALAGLATAQSTAESLDIGPSRNVADQLVPDPLGEMINIPAVPGNRATNQFVAGFIASFTLIIVSEIGDKTFFIAAILAIKRGLCSTFMGAISALIVMTLIAASMGRALPALLEPRYTQIASIVLFLFFGIKLLYEGFTMDSNAESEELMEVEMALGNTKKEDDMATQGDLETPTTIGQPSPTLSVKSDALARGRTFLFTPLRTLSAAFIEAFTLTFAAEWGDRSQIATVALGASKNIYGVNLGAILGHACCTGLAVIGGKVLATRISEKAVTLVGGTTFLFFALGGYLWDVAGWAVPH
eukprot:Blabericola_migrator_1__11833@NODE_719_length_6741_cov_45_534312_g518_i0_p3_GENE_NODE_719_length_6741_cov_45_534312_g518_i0NODE_719_length_6741_cov_45_534312_g518_i0_p3_ORF_typecomplete_len311_score35_90UPF0016/PF01169_19/2e19UPF0016/PF01169_19/1_4e27Mntp/PF02659_15/2_7e03Mntp/PF02659_15/1_1e05ALMT/PF11744_8/0_087OFeT_1/PF16955_5/2_3_NODE_719_length_6741_cov_45_534312_g518_i055636495